MTETTTETETSAAPEAPAKKGRGPTRANLKACDLIDEIADLDLPTRGDVLARLKEGQPAAAVRAEAKSKREAIRDMEIRARDLDRIAKMRQAADTLPELQRSFVIAALEAVQARKE